MAVRPFFGAQQTFASFIGLYMWFVNGGLAGLADHVFQAGGCRML